MMLLTLPSFLADFEELDSSPEKIATTDPFVLVNIARLLLVRVTELASARCDCVLHCFLPKY